MECSPTYGVMYALNLHQSQDEAMTKLRQEFEAQASEQLKKYDQKLVMLRDELELRRKTEIHEIEEVRLYEGVFMTP